VDVLHGLSPYVAPSDPSVADGVAFVYPAVGARQHAPLSWQGARPADVVFTALNLLAIPAALVLLGIRDRRLYGLVMATAPVVYGWHLANVTLILVAGLAALWRLRDRPWAAGLLVAALVSGKLFLWPAGIWLAATRRWRACAWALIAGVGMNLVAWSVLGWSELDRYRDLIGHLARLEEGEAYNAGGLLLHLGAGRTAAHVVSAALVAGICVRLVAAGYAGRDAPALGWATAAMLIASPIVSLPYAALLVVPLALARPAAGRDWAWLLPLWLCPIVAPGDATLVLALGCGTMIVTATVRPESRPEPAGG
jgi:hypothetical protein